jgi:hypothetical protein
MAGEVSRRLKIEQELIWGRFMFMMVGTGAVFPYSALTQPVDYWNTEFPDYEAEFIIAAVYAWVNMASVILFLLLGSVEPDYDFRMYTGFLGQFISLVLIPSSHFIGLSETADFVLVITCTVIAASMTSFIDSCLISYASRYPVKYKFQEYTLIGFGSATVIGSVYRLLTKWLSSESDDSIVFSSLIYFYCGAVTVLICIYAYWSISGMEATKELLELTKLRKDGIIDDNNAMGSTTIDDNDAGGGGGDAQNDEHEGGLLAPTTPTENDSLLSHNKLVPREEDDDDNLSHDSIVFTRSLVTHDPYKSDNRIRDIKTKYVAFKKVWWNELVLMLHYVTTYSLYPGMISVISVYNYESLNESGWWQQWLLFDYTVWSLIGRFFTDYRFGVNIDNVHIPVFLRAAIMIPAILFCVTGTFANDILSMFLVMVLAVTHGYLGTLCVVVINENTPPEDKATIGTVSFLATSLGTALSGTLAIFIEAWLKGP